MTPLSRMLVGNRQMMRDGRAQKAFGLFCLGLLLWAMSSSARYGLSRLFSEYALVANSTGAAEIAVSSNSADPQAHYARASTLAEEQRFDEATAAFERAIQLNPRDYYLWLKLGRTYDWIGNEAAARAALTIAIKLAPVYAAPHWELGNLLLRAGEREQAFCELRFASESNSGLLPAVIDLAWNDYEGDAAAVRRAVAPRRWEEQLALARYFAQRDRVTETLEMLGASAEGAASALRRDLLRSLLDQNRFAEAHRVWLSARAATKEDDERERTAAEKDGFSNGNFETPIKRDPGAGFGWQWSDEALAAVRIALDPNRPRAGTYSLQLNWAGDPHPALPIISQLIVIEPGRRYRLDFSARTEGLTSGGLPLIAVIDAADKDGDPLAASANLPQNSKGWFEHSIEFSARAKTTAAIVMLRRQCSVTPCPIYGRLWLDNFSLRPTTQDDK